MKFGKKISVYVSKENIGDGRRYNPCLCPIALAVSDKYKINPNRIYISPETVLHTDGVEYFYSLNKEGINFLKRFDRGAYVDPITLEFKLVKTLSIV